jgi:hypothetical protein
MEEMTGVGRFLVVTTTFLLALVLLIAPAAGAPKPWTKAQVEKTIVAKLVVKCPLAMANRSYRDTVHAATAQANCDNPAEPAWSRAVAACGVTSACVVPNDRGGGGTKTQAIDPLTLRFAQLDVQLHDKGTPPVYAKCASGKAKSTFLCGVQLARKIDIDPTIPLGDELIYRLCADVTAQGRVFRWKVRNVWTSGVFKTDPDPKGACGSLANRPR